VIIEEIVDEAEDLHIVGELIGGVEISHPIQRQLRVLVRIVANIILTTDDEHVKPGLELRRERIIAADLELVAGNARNVVPGCTIILPFASAKGLNGELSARARHRGLCELLEPSCQGRLQAWAAHYPHGHA
jgi:hypothetical protein